MRDYDIDVDGAGAPQRRERRETDGSGDHSHMEVSRALENARPDALGTNALLHLQRAAGNAGTAALVSGAEEEESPVKDVITSSGQSLDNDTKNDMESRFGADFSDVEVHTDPKAADSARSVSAQAYTVGNHVVFGDGKYQPATDEGRHMIAHELTHVVQQRSGPVDGTPAGGGVKVSDPGDRYEREADQNASDVLAPTATPADAGALQRAPVEEEEEQLQTLPIQRAEEEEEPTEEPASEEPAAETPVEETEEEQA